jgi:hypothetical protein
VRVHLPGWTGDGQDRIETRLREFPGVEAAQANPLTGNVLIRFNPRTTGPQPLLAALQQQPEVVAPEEPARSESDGAAGQARGLSASPWFRVGMRGLLGHAVVDSLWFGAGFLGRSLGLPLAGLRPLHLVLDVMVWGAALASAGVPRVPASTDSLEGR